MTSPKPDELRTSLQHIANQGTVLNREYRWSYEMAHGSDRRGRSEGGGHFAGDPNDPTGNLVSSVQKQKARRACEYAAKQVDEAGKALRAAIYACGQAMKETFEPAAEPLGMTGLAMKAEVRESEEKRDARVSAGDIP